ncbi:MAG: DUF6064 family protein [Ketobacteraceae bacterium]|nr:DUF6064 family protein [Ketobacteraceae bacterium]
MLADLQTYSLADFLPFSREVYLRLLERIHEAIFPWQAAALMAGMLVILCCWHQKQRPALILLAGAWMSVGIIFHIGFFSELVWAAREFAYAFFVQAGLLLILAIRTPATGTAGGLSFFTGWLLLVFSVVAFPLLSLLQTQRLLQSELFSVMPDPTVIATAGVFCIFRHKNPLLFFIPLLWGLVSSALAKALGHFSGFSVVLALALILMAGLLDTIKAMIKTRY